MFQSVLYVESPVNDIFYKVGLNQSFKISIKTDCLKLRYLNDIPLISLEFKSKTSDTVSEIRNLLTT